MKLPVKTADLDERRLAWMKKCKQMVFQLARRKRVLSIHWCPDSVWVEDDEVKGALKTLALLNSSIRTLSGEMDALEKGKFELGARALLDARPIGHHLRAAVSLLTAARFDDEWALECDEVNEVVSLAGGRGAKDVLELREAFELSGGILRPHLTVIRYGRNLDRWHVYLRETSLAKLLGREPCAELSALEIVRGTTSNVSTGEKTLLLG